MNVKRTSQANTANRRGATDLKSIIMPTIYLALALMKTSEAHAAF